MPDVIPFPTDPSAVPPDVRQGADYATQRLIPDMMAKCERLGLARYARRLRAMNDLLGGEPLPVVRKVAVL